MPIELVKASPGLADAPGWFGKIATLGDFAHRRLPHEIVRTCDAWLSSVMLGSREQLGARWLETYLNARLLRFAWAPGVAGPGWWFGVLMPSCDNVGRYFPLLVAQGRARPPQARAALDHLDAWLDHLADAAACTLGEGETTERFEQALGAAPPWPAPGTAVHEQYVGPDPGRRGTIGHWLRGAAAQDIQARLHGCSVWCRQGSTGNEGSIEALAGLPNASRFLGLLSGEDSLHRVN